MGTPLEACTATRVHCSLGTAFQGYTVPRVHELIKKRGAFYGDRDKHTATLKTQLAVFDLLPHAVTRSAPVIVSVVVLVRSPLHIYGVSRRRNFDRSFVSVRTCECE